MERGRISDNQIALREQKKKALFRTVLNMRGPWCNSGASHMNQANNSVSYPIIYSAVSPGDANDLFQIKAQLMWT